MPKRKDSRTTAAVAAEEHVQREMHAMVVREHGRWGGVPAKHLQWHYDLRRGKNRIQGSMLRWIDTVLEKCHTLADLDGAEIRLGNIPARICEYIRDRADDMRRALRNSSAFGTWTNDRSEVE